MRNRNGLGEGGVNEGVAHPWLSIEVKARTTLPAWIGKALVQADAGAEPDQLPVAILHQANRPHDKDLVCLRLSDFEEWFGGGNDAGRPR